MTFRVIDLPWLPPPPEDFTARRRALAGLDPAAAAAETWRFVPS